MEKIKNILEKNLALENAITLINWDLETEAPIKSIDLTSKNISILTEMSYNLLVNDEFKNMVYSKNIDELNEIDRVLIKKLKKDIFEIMSKIPIEDYTKYTKLTTESSIKWQEAKQKNDISIYKEYLEKVITYNKKIIKYRGYEGHPYSLLLNDYEEGLNVEIADNFFTKLKEELTPFIKEISNKKREELKRIKNIFFSKKYDISKQKLLSKEVSEILKFDYDKGVIKESEHPFTTSMSNKDVRITTHYYEDNPLSAIYSTIHEVGHALYELQVDDIYFSNFIGGGVSMGMHESQSRIYENMFCKNHKFLKKLYLLFDKYFGNEISFDEFELLINESRPSLIRTEADELTYPIHVMIRYEMEKEIFEDLEKEEDAIKLAKVWADKYEKYLGVRPENYKEGILQDIHWSQGSFGYFSSYALGSAYSCQIYKSMEKEINIEKDLEDANFTNINNWLKEKIHKYGSFKSPKELIKIATGEDFSPKYYIDYLKEKFSKIYNIEGK